MTGCAPTRTLVLILASLFVLLCAPSAYGNLCEVSWWQQGPPGFAVEAELRGGTDATGRCPNGDHPIHLAALFGNAAAVRALMNAGANAHVRNAAGSSAIELFEGRYENFVDRFGRAVPDLDEILRLIGAQAEALNEAQNVLCDVSFWRSPSEAAVLNALASGADPNEDCLDGLGSRPIHIALNLQVTPLLLSRPHASAIVALIDPEDTLLEDGVACVPCLLATNARGDTAVSLIEIRYTATKSWWEGMLHEAFGTLNDRSKDEIIRREEPKSRNEVVLYRVVRAAANQELYRDVRARTNRESREAIHRIAGEYGFR